MRHASRLLGCLLLALVAAALGCTGDTGPAGPAGPIGPSGVKGDPGPAAVDEGAIAGTVVDEASAPVAGVAIATEPASVTAVTDAAGAFALTGVAIGSYAVVASKAGYNDAVLPGVGVAAGASTQTRLVMVTVTPTSGAITGNVVDAKGEPVVGAAVSTDGQTTTAATDDAGAFLLLDVTPGYAFVRVTPPAGALLLDGETRRAVRVEAGGTVSGVVVTLSGRPSDSATYVGSAMCAVCHTTQTAAQHTSAHYRSLTPDRSRMISLNLWPAVGGTVASGVNARSPVDGTTTVAVYLCQNSPGAHAMKFGGTADCAAADGALVPVSGSYGGEGDGGKDNLPNLGKFKQRFLAKLDDVPAAASWTYAAGRDKDYLILPVQITQSGDGAAKLAGYHGSDWTARGRTFSAACAGCHNTGLTIAWNAASFITSYDYLDQNIGCEVCHGPASEHLAAAPVDMKLHILAPQHFTALAEREACGMCHGSNLGTSIDPAGVFGYPWKAANAGKVGGGIYVPGVYRPSEYIRGYGVPDEDGGGFEAWPDGLHGKAHRQQQQMMEASAHVNNPTSRLACSDCHDTHSLYQGPRAFRTQAGADTYELVGPTFKDDVLCLGCHAGAGPFAEVSKDDVAAVFTAAGRVARRNGTTLVFDADRVRDARAAVASAVGEHMQDEVSMGVAAYRPLDDAMPVGRCTSCHMPKVAKSGGWATGPDAVGASALIEGDQGSHVFDVIWPADSAALKKASGGTDSDIMPNSCGKCHAGARLSGD